MPSLPGDTSSLSSFPCPLLPHSLPLLQGEGPGGSGLPLASISSQHWLSHGGSLQPPGLPPEAQERPVGKRPRAPEESSGTMGVAQAFSTLSKILAKFLLPEGVFFPLLCLESLSCLEF